MPPDITRTIFTPQQREAYRLFLMGLYRIEAAREMDIEGNTYSEHLCAAKRIVSSLTLPETIEIHHIFSEEL